MSDDRSLYTVVENTAEEDYTALQTFNIYHILEW
ncbi:hypothetical protein PPHE_a6002 [Pseudoalteromonas phenolica O-BC30]|nr:hypothetical protein [Pseudoalteromonas phenolica O-BC30]